MRLDTLALICVSVPVAIWAITLFISAIALFPFGLIILAGFLIVGYLFYRVLKDRIDNKEDDYYEKNIDK
ncbi:MAG: hypothetical protein P8Y67_09250 [Alphaproteobacteria bacterium]